MTLFKDWREAQLAKQAEAKKARRRTPPRRFPVTENQAKAFKALSKCRFGAGSYDKRFVRNLQDAKELTEGQGRELARLAHRYRRQLGLDDAQAAALRTQLLADSEAGPQATTEGA